MRKEICGRIYDTETAERIAQKTYGAFGEQDGFEEILYRTPEGSYFLYGKGGADSPYPREKITRMGESRAEAWRREAEE